MLASIRGTSLNFSDTGEGRPILWIHGFPFSSELFTYQAAIPGHRHIVPDLRGFGESLPPTSPMSMREYAADALALLDHLGIPSCVAGGVSMGGYILFELLRQDAGRIEALLLCDTRELPDSEEGREGRRKSIREVRESGSVRSVVEAMLPKMLTEDTLKEGGQPAALVRRMMEGASPDGVVAALQAMADRPDSTATLRGCAAPALILAGEKDPITPPADAERMAGLLRNSSVSIIENAAHLANVERPDAFNRAVLQFLDGPGRVAAGGR